MSTAPATWPAGRAWPPRHVEPIAAHGHLEIVGHLQHDAELRWGVDGAHGVLTFDIAVGTGFPFEVCAPVPSAALDLQAATHLHHQLRTGVTVRVTAAGCVFRSDHSTAVMRLLDVTHIVAIQKAA